MHSVNCRGQCFCHGYRQCQIGDSELYISQSSRLENLGQTHRKGRMPQNLELQLRHLSLSGQRYDCLIALFFRVSPLGLYRLIYHYGTFRKRVWWNFSAR
ncbi:hypothetical protein ElyMa_003447300 [Elysia marginata]|uniref:Uncharacterized protein n=1 Tax=Elysia marginata TaxID=1093978 RepID=A0AAV4JSB1_9GAST|nr:hypothetical protein ElyMa_003447300 [Elysia marginata]